jgi:hypothetical protein
MDIYIFLLLFLAIGLPLILMIVGIRFLFYTEINKKRKGIIFIIIGAVVLILFYNSLSGKGFVGC